MESIQVLSDPLALARAAIDQFVHRAQEAIQARGRFSVALAGGSTPEPVYAVWRSQKFKLNWHGMIFISSLVMSAMFYRITLI